MFLVGVLRLRIPYFLHNIYGLKVVNEYVKQKELVCESPRKLIPFQVYQANCNLLLGVIPEPAVEGSDEAAPFF
jgi:hypothetical protein